MFCKNCGKYNPDNAQSCRYCGCTTLVKSASETRVRPSSNSYVSKSTEGVLMALFLGVIGLIIGLLLYPSGTYERESFLSAWVKTFVITIIVAVVLVVFTVGCAYLEVLNFM